jgi:hypothetical protein
MGRLRTRTGRLHALILSLGVLLTPTPPAQAAGVYHTVESDGLRIVMDSEWVGQTAPGYIPIRFDITNSGAPRTIDIVERGGRYNFGTRTAPYYGSPQQGRLSILQRLTVARGSRVYFTIPLPVSASNENYVFEVREDGEVIHNLGSYSVQGGVLPDRAGAILVFTGGTATSQAAEGWARSVSSGTGGAPAVIGSSRGKAPSLDVILEPQRLPTNWLGYTSLRALAIGGAEWQQLNDAQRNAVRTWVACGGDLLLVDGDLAEWRRSTSPAGTIAGETPSVPYLLGRVHAFTAEQLTTAGFEATLMTLPAGRDGSWALPANRAVDWNGTFEHGLRMPIGDYGQIHARAYVVILFLFALLIGPANYLILTKRRQQALLVVTVPLIALAFIGLLAGYVIAGEGLSVHARAATITLLDQGRQQAATRAAVSMYAAGRSPRGGMQVGRETAVILAGGATLPSETDVDLNQTQQIHGLVRARTPANIETVSLRSARERLVVHRQGDRIDVVNGLGATIRNLTLNSGSARYRLASPLGNGERRVLEPTGVVGSPVGAAHPYAVRYTPMMQLPAESYVAVLDRSPFWQAGVDSVIEHDSVHVVMGLLEP